jgi:hypothetical protein
LDALTFFLARYTDLHARSTEDLLAGLDDEQLRQRPHPSLNTIAWLLWHMARIEDVAASRFIADLPQTLHEGQWRERMATARRDVGTGMDEAEVDDLSARVDLGALLGYWQAVGRRTLDIVRAIGPDDLDVTVPVEHTRQVCLAEGVTTHTSAWLAEVWGGKSRGWHLAQPVLIHGWGHLYEARVVKGFWGISGR